MEDGDCFKYVLKKWSDLYLIWFLMKYNANIYRFKISTINRKKYVTNPLKFIICKNHNS